MVRGPLASLIALLFDSGWDPVSARLWIAPTGAHVHVGPGIAAATLYEAVLSQADAHIQRMSARHLGGDSTIGAVIWRSRGSVAFSCMMAVSAVGCDPLCQHIYTHMYIHMLCVYVY